MFMPDMNGYETPKTLKEEEGDKFRKISHYQRR